MELTLTAMPNTSPNSNVVRRLVETAPCPLAPPTARFARLLFDARLPVWLRRKAGVTHWRVGLADVSRFREAGWIELRQGFANASAAIDLACHPALAAVATASKLSGSGVDRPEPAENALRHAVAAVLLEPFTERCAELGLDDLHVAAVRHGALPRQFGGAFAVSLSTDEHRLDCVLAPPDAAYLEAIEAGIRAQRLPLTPAVGALRVPGRLCIGAKTMRITTLRSLRCDDVVLRALDESLPDWRSAPEHTTELYALWGTPGAPGIRARVRVGIDTMTLTGEPEMTYADTEDQEFGDNPGAFDVGGLSLPVKFEIDTVAIPVSQLTALRPGYVVELTVPLAESRIRISAHGQTIGFGELVTVGEHLGVRILDMEHGDDTVQ